MADDTLLPLTPALTTHATDARWQVVLDQASKRAADALPAAKEEFIKQVLPKADVAQLQRMLRAIAACPTPALALCFAPVKGSSPLEWVFSHARPAHPERKNSPLLYLSKREWAQVIHPRLVELS